MDFQLDDGSSELDDYLRDYKRVTVAQACKYHINKQESDNIGIWIKARGLWRQLRDVEQRLRWVKYQEGKSACQSIITKLFGLSYAQYRKMKTSFEKVHRTTKAGIYVLDERDTTKPEFVIVIELPNGQENARKAIVGGTGTHLALGVVGILGEQYLSNRKKRKQPQ